MLNGGGGLLFIRSNQVVNAQIVMNSFENVALEGMPIFDSVFYLIAGSLSAVA